jgi:hypothetical protein
VTKGVVGNTMRSYLLTTLFLFKGPFCNAQTYNESLKTDTFILKNIEFKKVIAYKINYVTILVNYNDFMKTFTRTWREWKDRDKNHVRQHIILRQKYSYQKDVLEGRGGWLYFIPGDKIPFLSGTDWVS